ncbi:hypothetical protein KY284_032483 [Solanum tuberosum]|nr:hypothetical protein KY284_032483 [Solanum tuberosum]
MLGHPQIFMSRLLLMQMIVGKISHKIEPIDPVNIDDRDLSNYGSPSASDSDDLSNAEESGDNVPFKASSSDDDFLMPNRSPRPMSMSPFRNHEIPYLDHLQDGPDIFGDTHDEYTSQRTWGEPEDFMNGVIYIEKGMLFNSKKQLQRAVKLLHLKIVRERVEQGCRFRLTSFNDKHTNMWKVGRYIKEHTCDMGTCRDGHFNLDVEMIANVLRVDIVKTPRRKTYLGRKRAFEKVYGTWEGSFAELPRFMEALKHFDLGTIVEWKTERRVDVIEDLLIPIATDGNGSILPLAFAIVANESMETWSLFLDHLHLHVVKGRRAANHCQEKKFLEKMEMIKEINPEAYVWLMKNGLDKWTLHWDGGRRWGMLPTNSSESFNGLLKSARGLPVTAMTHMHHGRGGNKHIVNASQGTCQCGKWQSYHIPCSHAIKGFDQIGYQAWEHMAPEFSVRSYKTAYSGQFNPLGGENRSGPVTFIELHSLLLNHKFINDSSFSAFSLSSSTLLESMNQPAAILAIKVLQMTVMSTPIPIEVEVVHIVAAVDVEDVHINELSPIAINNGTPMNPILDVKFSMVAIIFPTLAINAKTTHHILLHT